MKFICLQVITTNDMIHWFIMIAYMELTEIFDAERPGEQCTALNPIFDGKNLMNRHKHKVPGWIVINNQ